MRRVLSEAGLSGDGYNIVLQGDVTNLATMTPHKRRGVLEQVAGVTAYDEEIRKANTQRKHVENSIETIDIFEADQKGRLKELEKEREQALRFRELKEEADLARLTLEQSRHRNRQGEVSLLSEERSSYVAKEKQISEEMLESSRRLDDYDAQLVQIGKELEGVLGGDAKGILDKIRQHEIDLETASDRIGDYKRSIEIAEEEMEILVREREGADLARSKSEQKISELQRSVIDSKKALKKASNLY